ncbi:MAG TPA: hypothetical protein VG797_01710 [Phycisphaerales bacterium]|nr:hypothetical protein [Phycisphaerales bacterium]
MMNRRRVMMGVASIAALAGLVGCSAHESQAARFRSNPTPEIDTTGQTKDEVANKLTIVADTDWRMFNEDLGRMFLLDKPSLATPKPLGW